jgi:hypothetical protein
MNSDDMAANLEVRVGQPASLSSSVKSNPKLVDLESAAECEMSIHPDACHVTTAQLWCGCAENFRLKRNTVYKIVGKLEAIGENRHADRAALRVQSGDASPTPSQVLPISHTESTDG